MHPFWLEERYRDILHSTSQRPCMIDGNMECGALLALIPKPERSSTRRRKATTDNQEVMNAGEILALLPVALAAKKRKTWLKHVRSNGRRDQMTGAMQQQQLLAGRRAQALADGPKPQAPGPWA